MNVLIPVLLLMFTLLSGCGYESKYDDSNNDNQLIAYKVEDKDGNYAYLFGTIHAGNKVDYPFRKEIEDAFNESNYLAVEVDINKQTTIDFNRTKYPIQDMDVSQESLMHFKEVISTYPEEYKTMAMDYDTLVTYDASTTMLFTAQATISNSRLSLLYGMDQYFLDRANKDKKEIVEMEGYSSQVNTFYQLDQCCTDYMLRSLKTLKDNTTLLEKQYTLILNGDVEAFVDTMFPEGPYDSEAVEYDNLFIHDRNNKMVGLVKEYLASGETYFIAVGAGHVVGETGIMNQLEQEGYIVTRL